LKVFIDANVLISGIVFDGNELKVLLDSLKKGYVLVISEHVVEESFRTILDKFPEHCKLLYEFIELANFEILPKEEYLDKLSDYDIVRDKHDRHVLASAVITNCKYIITGDKDLLVLKKYDKIEILKAKAFIDKHLK